MGDYQEFQAWLIEVKKMDVETLPNTKRKDMFNTFMEGMLFLFLSEMLMAALPKANLWRSIDFNTATMPHEK
jgi:hypothetical protein